MVRLSSDHGRWRRSAPSHDGKVKRPGGIHETVIGNEPRALDPASVEGRKLTIRRSSPINRTGDPSPMLTLTVPDITCGHCAGVIEKAVKSVDPAATVAVDLAGKRVTVETRAPFAAVSIAIEEAGYPNAAA
jgi:copper chaperone